MANARINPNENLYCGRCNTPIAKSLTHVYAGALVKASDFNFYYGQEKSSGGRATCSRCGNNYINNFYTDRKLELALKLF